MLDFEQLFKTKLLAGSQWRSVHISRARILPGYDGARRQSM
jgi:hypothetical protein